MKQKPKKTTVSAYLDKDVAVTAQRIADERRWSLSQIVAVALEEYIARHTEPKAVTR